MDIERGRTIPMLCSTLTLVFATIAAGLFIAIPPGASAASYINSALGPQIALLTADTSKPELPSMISISMFRICYKSPGTTCLALSLGLSIDPVSFEGADKWQQILPPIIFTQVWAVLAASACSVTIVSAFAYCKGMPPVFRWFILILAVVTDVAYFAITAALFFILKQRIETDTDYVPHPVAITSIVYIVPVAMLLLIPIITFFIPSNEEHIHIPQTIIAGGGGGGRGPRPMEKLMAMAMLQMLGKLDGLAKDGKASNDGKEDQENALGANGASEKYKRLQAILALASGAALPQGIALPGSTNAQKPNPFETEEKRKSEAETLFEKRQKLDTESAADSETVTERTVARQLDKIEEIGKLLKSGKGSKPPMFKWPSSKSNALVAPEPAKIAGALTTTLKDPAELLRQKLRDARQAGNLQEKPAVASLPLPGLPMPGQKLLPAPPPYDTQLPMMQRVQKPLAVARVAKGILKNNARKDLGNNIAQIAAAAALQSRKVARIVDPVPREREPTPPNPMLELPPPVYQPARTPSPQALRAPPSPPPARAPSPNPPKMLASSTPTAPLKLQARTPSPSPPKSLPTALKAAPPEQPKHESVVDVPMEWK